MNRRELMMAGIAAALSPRSLLAGSATLDVAYINAAAWTGAAGAERTDALGIVGNRIAAVGADAVRAATGRGTEIIDLEGAFVAPGFIDNHTHFLRASQGLAQADLRHAETPEELKRLIAESARALPEGQWLQGGNWDEQRWDGELPTRHWIDPVTPDTPVAVVRTDQHMMLLNSLALKRAGIDRDTPDPPGGLILRGEDGEPTGIVKDRAKDIVLAAIPEPSDADVDAAIRRGIDYGLSLGVTQVHVKALDWATHHSLRRLRAQGEPGMRFYSFVPLQDWEALATLVEEEGRGDDWVRWGGLKGLVDGSLGSRTALFHDPYTDDPDTRGIAVADPEDLRRWIAAGDSRGLQVAVHAIGDKANDLLLDMFADVMRENGERGDRRFLVEHAQHILPAQIPRFAELGVIPSMQPFHAIDDGRWAERRIGRARLHGTYAFKSLLDAGALLSFGSDWPVAPLSPLAGIEAAVLRQTTDGAHPEGWLPEEKIGAAAALRAYTVNNARAGRQEDRLGRLTAGMIADFVVLGDDLLRTAPEKISQAPVLRTVVDGRPRYDTLA